MAPVGGDFAQRVEDMLLGLVRICLLKSSLFVTMQNLFLSVVKGLTVPLGGNNKYTLN